MRKYLVFFLLAISSLFCLYQYTEIVAVEKKAHSIGDQPLSEKGQKVFLGVIIKNDDQLIPSFLATLEKLDYDKKLIDVQVDIYNETESITELVEEWAKKHKGEYSQVICIDHNNSSESMTYNEERFDLFREIKDGYLRRTKELACDYCMMIESDAFIAPFTLKELISKKKPIIAPLLRPVPESNDPFRNFFCDVTEQGYYQDHSDYFPIADGQRRGTFSVPCVHTVYLIHADYIDNLSFIDGVGDWEFLAFSRNARENGIDQYICNEREFGSFLHFYKEPTLKEEKAFSLVGMDKEVTPQYLHTLFSSYYVEDPYIKEHIERFPFEQYAIYRVENRDIFYVDEIYDYIKSWHIKKGAVWEDNIHHYLKEYTKPGTVAIDIGGHMGTHTLNLSRIVGESGTVHVFEPQVKMFSELLVNMSLNACDNIVCHRRALGNEEKWVEMCIPRPDNEGMAYVKNSEDTSQGDRVKMTKLDNFHLDNISMIKIDVEGFEMEVIEGAKETILRNKPVMIVEIFSGPENSRRIAAIEQLGYTSTHLGGDDYLFLPKN